MSKLIVQNMINNKNGLILQISSYGGFVYLFDVGYGVAHAAMDRLSYDMATELKEHNVRAITMHPGAGQTEITAFPDGESPPMWVERYYHLWSKLMINFLIREMAKQSLLSILQKNLVSRRIMTQDGSVNEARYEGSRPYKQMMLRTPYLSMI